jgi:sulfur carrier protein ThiS
MNEVSPRKEEALDDQTKLEVQEALKIDSNIFENSLRLSELTALWEHRPAVESAGGLTLFCADQLGASATQTSKRLTVGKYIVLNVGADAVIETGIKAFEVVYQAAREVQAGASVFDVLEKYALTPTRAALEKNKTPKPQTNFDLAFRDIHVKDLFERMLTSMVSRGVTPPQTVERLAALGLEQPDRLKTLFESMEVGA